MDISFFEYISNKEKNLLIQIFQNNKDPIHFISVDYEQSQSHAIEKLLLKSSKANEKEIPAKNDDSKDSKTYDTNETEKTESHDNINDKENELNPRVTIDIEKNETLQEESNNLDLQTEQVEKLEKDDISSTDIPTSLNYLSDDDDSNQIPTSLNYLSEDEDSSIEDYIDDSMQHYNQEEAYIASLICLFLSLNNYSVFNKVAITSIHGDQISLIRKLLCKEIKLFQPYYDNLCPDAEDISKRIDIHRLQNLSKEYDIIIFSLVDNDISLIPWEQFATVLTSFKAKLIILGSGKSSTSSPFFNEILSLIGTENIIHLESPLSQ